MNSLKHYAIVFNCHFNGLSIIQELGKNGIKCIAMDCIREIGTYSKYAYYKKCPDPLEKEDEFIHFLYKFCEKFKYKPVLFPTNDHWATAISKNKNTLSRVSIPIVANWDIMKILINKNLFYEIGERNNYLTPRSWKVENLQYLKDTEFPIVVKPICRRFSSNEDIKCTIQNMDRLRFNILNNRDELTSFIEKEKNFVDKLIFQEYIKGLSDRMYTIGIYANDKSEIMGLFTGHKVRGYPADSGDCIVGEYMKVPDYVIKNTIKIVKDLKYSGIAEFEYKKDLISEEFKLIEINPRSWSWIGITQACGVNLPLIAYKDSCEQNADNGLCMQKAEFGKNPKNGSVKYIRVFPDIFNCLIKYKHDYPEWNMSFFEWINNIKADRIIFAEFNAGDWLISIRILIEILLMSVNCIKNKVFKIKLSQNSNLFT